MTIAPIVRLQPPLNEVPLDGLGRNTKGWTDYYQALADRLTDLSKNAGTKTDDDAAVGDLGEYVSAAGSASLSSTLFANVATVSLTAGDWDVRGCVKFLPAATTHPFSFGASASSVSGAFGRVCVSIPGTYPVGQWVSIDAGGPSRFSLATETTIYLVASSAFTTGAMSAEGFLSARRAR